MVDLLRAKLELQGGDTSGYDRLRGRIVEMEDIQDQARDAIQQLSEAVDKLQSPALKIGTLLDLLKDDTALVAVGGSDYICNIADGVEPTELETGMRVSLNEAYALTDTYGIDSSGPVLKVKEVLRGGRLRVGNDSGISDVLVRVLEREAQDSA